MTSKKAKIVYGAFGAGLRPWPSATISYHLCNFCHPAKRQEWVLLTPLCSHPSVTQVDRCMWVS